ncbi:acetyl-CoA C-acyltransferase [Siphonobacter aquaeclarae]|uniref:acetyl-CoA C-acetyltransferase n=1 Tax=Siphonobacter aquaeclarae TaxID=563176 RepID=A0A1G9KA23_9BACT|nr:acetyl-CoA C-acyltransferase [Siphonobacter aquaeclarae]SDL46567.1 acetyl-CoA C-acetyltransferase [Siphonobacter aquaeclarae]
MSAVVLVSAVRTPIGSYAGGLSSFQATQLGSLVIREALSRAGVSPEQVDEVLMGNVCSANLGQAPARQAALGAGLPPSVRCTTINKVCASGMKSVMLAAQSIQLGYAEVVVAGGMESMSNVPYYIPQGRFGYKYGSGTLVDGLEKDGLLDAYDKQAMGVYADRTATRYGISREEQDAFTIRSYQRAAEATRDGRFAAEIVPVEVPQKKGAALVIAEDEEYTKVQFDKIPSLRPAFGAEGTVTAASSSPLSDGASAFVLMSREKANALGLTPIAAILGFADAEQEPEWFTTTPALAVPEALKRAGLSADEIDFFEVNEAFAVVPLAFSQLLGIPEEKLNIYGGAVALGHPLGCSGARILTTLTSVLRNEGKRYGVAGICNGGGGASAIVIERL